MGKVIISEFVTLDNVMEDPGGSESFSLGGWTRPYHNEEIERFKLDELMGAEALVMGRVTYEGFAKVWPTMEDSDGFAKKINQMGKYVVSKTLGEALWSNSHLLQGDIKEEISNLKNTIAGDILVFGSGDLVDGLLQYDLVDEIRLLVYPVVLGVGKELFKDGMDFNLKTEEIRQLGDVALLRYKKEVKS